MENIVSVASCLNNKMRYNSRLYWALLRERVGTIEDMSSLRATQHKIGSDMMMWMLPVHIAIGMLLILKLHLNGIKNYNIMVVAGFLFGSTTIYYIWKRLHHYRDLRVDLHHTNISTLSSTLHGLLSAYLFYQVMQHLPERQYLEFMLLWPIFIFAGTMATAPLPRASLFFNSISTLSSSIIITIISPDSMIALLIPQIILFILSAYCSSIFSIIVAQNHFSHLALDERNQDVGLLMQDFVEVTSQWLWRINSDGKFTSVPEALAIFLNQNTTSLIGTNFVEHMNKLVLNHSRYTNEGDKLLMLVNYLHMKQPFKEITFQVTYADHLAWWSISAQPVFDANDNFDGFRGLLIDVSTRFAETQEIIQLAHYDSLTGLHNRASFTDQISNAWQRCKITGREFALFSIDLDHFKQVNDTFGHPAGDTLLREAAMRITNIIGPNDVAARLGGDEFAVLHWIERDHALLPFIAQKIITHLHETFIIDQCPVRVGASIGIAIAPIHGADPDSLARNGDAALYRAKAAGRGTAVMFDESMQDWLQRRRRLEADLRVAVSSGTLQLAYQPVINTKTGTVDGCEALARWKHPEFGWIAPTEFIPIAEESGLIMPLGEWVLREACKTASHWPKSISLAVNLSSHQLQAGTLLKIVESVLHDTGFSADRLDLEITETIVLEATQNILDIMHKLRSMGVSISLDDFGTGYSSLSYLRSFPFDRIKIDRSFVIDALESTTSAAIIETIIQLSQRLNMGLTVEGVETTAQYDMVKRLGADCIQGYLFSKPLSAKDLELWLKTQKTSSMIENAACIAA
jgi:diguanylate cyclase (GGDEF)-like protein